MSVSGDSVPESASSSYERRVADAALPEAAIFDEPDVLDLHREINARRAQIENPELLRSIRSL